MNRTDALTGMPGIPMPGVVEIAAGVRSGRFTAEAVAEACLARVAERDGDIEAWTFLDPALTLEQARAIDRAGAHGPLAGVPIGVKDNIDTADRPTGYGSQAYEGFRPAWDAPCVSLSRQAGALVLGKTVSTEFAMSSPGKTRNPANRGHTPGGSSSGSCAAVAAGMVPLAFGTQTAGSIIRPACYCGVVGYKPSFGLLDRTAIKVLAGSLDTLGLITRSARDAAYAAAVLSQRPSLTVPETLAAPRVGLLRTSRWELAEPGTRLAIDRAVAALADRGVVVSDTRVPDWFESVLAVQDTVMAWEATLALSHERLMLSGRLTETTRAFLAEKARTTLAEYDAAVAALPAMRAAFQALFEDLDVLLTPAAPGEAPEGLASTGDPVFNRAWTMLHGPCVSVPAGAGPHGLPVGVQLVGRVGDDAGVLAAAAFLQDALASA